MTDTYPRRFTTVTAPTLLSAIGEMLRKAFGKPASTEKFDTMLSTLGSR